MSRDAVQEFIDPKYGTSNPDDLDKLNQTEAKFRAAFEAEETLYPRTIHERYVVYRAAAESRGEAPMTFEEYQTQQSSRSKPEGKEK